MAGPGYVDIPVFDAYGAVHQVRFWSSDGTPTGILVAAYQPNMFAPAPETPFPEFILAGATYNTGLITTAGFRTISTGATLSQTGTMVVRRYMDATGLVQTGEDTTVPMVADSPTVIVLNDGLPTAAFRLLITNTSVDVAGLSATAILLGA